MKKKKPFGQTTVGKILKGAVGLVNPTLGSLIQGEMSVEQVISSIKNSDCPTEDKIKAQEMVLEAYEAEVEDRASARQREMAAIQAGSNDILFKTVGWGITLSFVAVIAGAIGLWEIPKESQRLFDMGFGAVVAAFTQVIGYYFGSSMGSKNKTLFVTCEEYINRGSFFPKIKAGSPNVDFADEGEVTLIFSLSTLSRTGK